VQPQGQVLATAHGNSGSAPSHGRGLDGDRTGSHSERSSSFHKSFAPLLGGRGAQGERRRATALVFVVDHRWAGLIGDQLAATSSSHRLFVQEGLRDSRADDKHLDGERSLDGSDGLGRGRRAGHQIHDAPTARGSGIHDARSARWRRSARALARWAETERGFTRPSNATSRRVDRRQGAARPRALDEIPVIIFSAHGCATSLFDELICLGCRDCITKPYAQGQLLDTVRAVAA
jgi:hypothetical protein